MLIAFAYIVNYFNFAVFILKKGDVTLLMTAPSAL